MTVWVLPFKCLERFHFELELLQRFDEVKVACKGCLLEKGRTLEQHAEMRLSSPNVPQTTCNG